MLGATIAQRLFDRIVILSEGRANIPAELKGSAVNPMFPIRAAGQRLPWKTETNTTKLDRLSSVDVNRENH